MSEMPASEVRRPKPEEVAFILKLWRAHLSWSQEALAAEAHVDVRTVQRAETGHKVSDDALHRFATALKMNSRDALTVAREILSPEEFGRREKAKSEELHKKNWVIPATVAQNGTDLTEWLKRISAWSHSAEHFEGDAAEDVGALLNLIGDIVLFDASDLAPSDLIEMGATMTEMLQRLSAAGIRVSIGDHTLHLRSSSDCAPIPMHVGYLRVSATPPSSFIVPKDTQFNFG